MSEEELLELAFKDTTELLGENNLVLLDIIEVLHIDRKRWIEQYTKAHNDYVVINKENQQLKDRIDKAIEYINEWNIVPCGAVKERQAILEILKGEENENR